MQGPWNSTGPVGAVGAAPASSSVTLRNSEDLMRSQPSSPSDWRSASAPVTCSSGRVVPLLRSTAQTWNALPWSGVRSRSGSTVTRQGPLKAVTTSTGWLASRSEEHTSELQYLMRISYAVFCLQKKNWHSYTTTYE